MEQREESAATRSLRVQCGDQVIGWGIERNDVGWEADVFLYCSEVLDPITGWRVPLLPSLGDRS